MAKTYAAFYLPPEEKEVKLPDQKNVDRIKSSVSRALQNAKQSVLNFDVNAMARNMDLQSSTEFVQRYATGALSKIINGEPVTNKTMLDSLFNTYAPALNAGLAQTGFNSLVEMRNAAQAGNGSINVANFVQGFSDGLSIVQSAADKTDYRSKYGEEIPIDVISKFIYTYKTETAYQKIEDVEFLPQYINDLEPLNIKIFGHVKNENAELWNMNEFSNKLVDIMLKKEKLYFRVGKSIYENCIISLYQPTIKNIYDIKFEMDIKMQYQLNTYSQNDNPLIKMNPRKTQGDSGNFNYNIACKEVYKGIMG